MKKVNLADKFDSIQQYWRPRIAGELDGLYIKLVKLKGKFIWHHHEAEDELFLVVRGSLRIQLRDHEVRLDEGDFLVVPKGVEHRPIAEEEAHVVLIEPASTVNTGEVRSERTVQDEWI